MRARGIWLKHYFSIPEKDLMYRWTWSGKCYTKGVILAMTERLWMVHLPSGALGMSSKNTGPMALKAGEAWSTLAVHPMFLDWWITGRGGRL